MAEILFFLLLLSLCFVFAVGFGVLDHEVNDFFDKPRMLAWFGLGLIDVGYHPHVFELFCRYATFYCCISLKMRRVGSNDDIHDLVDFFSHVWPPSLGCLFRPWLLFAWFWGACDIGFAKKLSLVFVDLVAKVVFARVDLDFTGFDFASLLRVRPDLQRWQVMIACLFEIGIGALKVPIYLQL